MKRKKDDWVRGFVCAAAIKTRIDGLHYAGLEILEQGGLSDLQYLIDSGADESDLEALFPETKYPESGAQVYRRRK